MGIDAVLVGFASGAPSPLTTSTNATQATGSTFEIDISYDDAGTVTTPIVDNKGNTYTQIGTKVHTGGSGHSMVKYRCENGVGGAGHGVSVAFSADPNGTVYLTEITGAAAASFDQTAQGVPTTSPYTVTTPPLAQAAEVAIACFGTAASVPAYASSNMTIIAQETNGAAFWTSCLAKLVLSSAAAFTPSFTETSGNNDTCLSVATFKEGGAPPAATPLMPQACY